MDYAGTRGVSHASGPCRRSEQMNLRRDCAARPMKRLRAREVASYRRCMRRDRRAKKNSSPSHCRAHRPWRRRGHHARDQVRLWARPRQRAEDAARGEAHWRTSWDYRREDVSWSACVAARVHWASGRVRSTCLRRHAAGLAASGWRTQSMCSASVLRLRRKRPRRSSKRAGTRIAARLHADQLSDGGGGIARGRTAAHCPPIIWSTRPTIRSTNGGSRSRRRHLAWRVLFPARNQAPPIERLRELGVPMAVSTDCNPGTSPIASLLLAMNMACVLFRMTSEEALRGVTTHAARAARPATRPRDLASRHARRPRDLANPPSGTVMRGSRRAPADRGDRRGQVRPRKINSRKKGAKGAKKKTAAASLQTRQLVLDLSSYALFAPFCGDSSSSERHGEADRHDVDVALEQIVAGVEYALILETRL